MKTKKNSGLQVWPVERLRPNPHNSRVHPEEQIAKLVASIRQFGFTRPILVDEQGTILVGHGALLAALDLGLSKVPVVVLDHLTEQQKRAYMIADNQLAQNSHWDTEKLRGEIETLEKDVPKSPR